MLATKRDHAVREMMVALRKRVECSAKIAMSTLPSRPATMRLLRKHDWPRRIFLEARAELFC
jgi:hypothetical protein